MSSLTFAQKAKHKVLSTTSGRYKTCLERMGVNDLTDKQEQARAKQRCLELHSLSFSKSQSHRVRTHMKLPLFECTYRVSKMGNVLRDVYFYIAVQDAYVFRHIRKILIRQKWTWQEFEQHKTQIIEDARVFAAQVQQNATTWGKQKQPKNRQNPKNQRPLRPQPLLLPHHNVVAIGTYYKPLEEYKFTKLGFYTHNDLEKLGFYTKDIVRKPAALKQKTQYPIL